jgi:hypothetical protein
LGVSVLLFSMTGQPERPRHPVLANQEIGFNHLR